MEGHDKNKVLRLLVAVLASATFGADQGFPDGGAAAGR
jgi:hypothetical protein